MFFSRYWPFFQLAIFGHETWPLAKVPEVAHTLSFYPKGSKLSLFLLYGQRFLRYGPIFKIAIFGHETWSLATVPYVAHTLFLPQGVEIELIFGQRAAVSEKVGPIFNIAIFGHKTWPLAKVPEVAHTYPRRVEIEPIFTLRAAVSKIRTDFSKFPYLGMNLEFEKRSESCKSTLFLPKWVEIKFIFVLRAGFSR